MWVGVNFLWVGVGWCGSVWVGAQNDITDCKMYQIYCKKYSLLLAKNFEDEVIKTQENWR